MKMTIPSEIEGKELFDFLIKNKSILIAEKKYNVKHSDAFKVSHNYLSKVENVTKSASTASHDGSTITVPCVINTTNIVDSHKDLHLPGLWKKSLSENKNLYLLQEHSMTFKGIITDEVNAYTKNISWKELGLDAPGETQALIFEATIPKSRNEFMFNEYKSGRVKNHSVGMRYVQIELAVNDPEYKDEYAVWNKYIDEVVNKDETEADGYFFAVKEAKVVEGSAVPIGSNRITPVLNAKTDTTIEPQESTQEQPLQRSEAFDIEQLLKNFQTH